MKLSTPLHQVKGIGKRFASSLERLELYTVKDILYHFPNRYQDFSDIQTINNLKEGDVVTIQGTIASSSITRTPRKRMYVVQTQIEDDTGKAKAVWFNQKYLITTLTKGKTVNISGTVSFKGTIPFFSSPEFEIISSGKVPRHTGKLVPIYPETKGVTSKLIRFTLGKILPFIKVEEFLPKNIIDRNDLLSLTDAFSSIHSPSSLSEAQRAFERFSFQDLFLLQLTQAYEKQRLSEYKAFSSSNTRPIHLLKESLPFTLTTSQEKVLQEVLDDIKKDSPSSRLIQGDVGSGKTIVALLTALIVAENGFQSVFMAPTEVLAQQHFSTFKKLFSSSDIGVALLTSHHSLVYYGEGLESSLSKKELVSLIQKGSVRIVFGTHTLIQKSVSFKELALLIVDEQHRFGVEQRSRLTKQEDTLPHFISMSATPIPRTLSLTVYGTLSLSTIDELPKNRKKVQTYIMPPDKQKEAYKKIKSELDEGYQCFVVCPRIESSEETETKNILFLDAKSVKEECERLRKGEFKEYRVGMLHGKMKSEEKKEVVRSFSNKEIDVLVSTSIIEVGIDMPDATVMIIEGAELFGLAQLHQFRGRIGRGRRQSYCFLFTKSHGAQNKRLKALVSAKNGFELAEIDLSLRGPGQFLGTDQSGIPDLVMKALKRPDLVQRAQKEASVLIQEDSSLKSYPYLAAYLHLFKKRLHFE